MNMPLHLAAVVEAHQAGPQTQLAKHTNVLVAAVATRTGHESAQRTLRDHHIMLITELLSAWIRTTFDVGRRNLDRSNPRGRPRPHEARTLLSVA